MLLTILNNSEFILSFKDKQTSKSKQLKTIQHYLDLN